MSSNWILTLITFHVNALDSRLYNESLDFDIFKPKFKSQSSCPNKPTSQPPPHHNHRLDYTSGSLTKIGQTKKFILRHTSKIYKCAWVSYGVFII